MTNKTNFSQGYSTTDSYPRWWARGHEARRRYVRRAQHHLRDRQCDSRSRDTCGVHSIICFHFDGLRIPNFDHRAIYTEGHFEPRRSEFQTFEPFRRLAESSPVRLRRSQQCDVVADCQMQSGWQKFDSGQGWNFKSTLAYRGWSLQRIPLLDH